ARAKNARPGDYCKRFNGSTKIRAAWPAQAAPRTVSGAPRKPAWSLALYYKPLIMIANINTFKN
ncbi:MAG: hypothetical protein Q7R89_02335, partial [bacterium]|nr:hypothetical protein [bacterium]